MAKGVFLAVSVVLAASAATHAQMRPDEVQQRRNQIQLMESVLARAVSQGAADVSRRLAKLDPSMSMMMLSGQARARGFVLEGYGIFFDVEIPALRQSAVWSIMTMERDMQIGSALAALRRIVESIPDGATRQQAQQAFKRVELQVGPVQSQRAANEPPPPGQISGATVDAPGATSASSAIVPDQKTLEDPNQQYTDTVKDALIDAMLNYSLSMNIGPDEWLTVAARDSEGPLSPGEIYEAMTIVIRVKGSDLAIFASDRTRQEEIRRKVDVRVF